MSRERKIVGIRTPDAEAPPAPPFGSESEHAHLEQLGAVQAGEPLLAAPAADPLWFEEEAPYVAPRDTVALWAFAILAVATAWLGAMAFEHTNGFSRLPTGSGWVSTIAACFPPLITILIAMLARARLSARAAQEQLGLLSHAKLEQEALSQQLQALFTQIRTAEENLRERAGTLASFGLDASARMTAASADLTQRFEQCDIAARSVAENSAAALTQIDSLTVGLPKIDEVAVRLTDNLRQAGQTAFQFGGQLEATIAALTQETSIAQSALEDAHSALNAQIAAMRDAGSTVAASIAAEIANLISAADDQKDRCLALMTEFAGSASDATNRSTAEITDARIRLHGLIEQDQQALRKEVAALSQSTEQLRSTIASASGDVDLLGSSLFVASQQAEADAIRLAAEFGTRTEQLRSAMQLMTDGVANLSDKIKEGDKGAVDLVQRAETLLIALDSVAREIDETIPGALARVDAQIESTTARFAVVAPLADQGFEKVGALHKGVQAVAEELQMAEAALVRLDMSVADRAASQRSILTDLESQLRGIEAQLESLADGSSPQVADRLANIGNAGEQAVRVARERINQLLDETSEAMRDRLTKSMASVTGEALDERLLAISNQSEAAVSAATAASDKLMRQLITIADASAALEQRAHIVEAAAETAESQSMTQQLALLSEALQSTAVDITRVLDTDIADQAWAAYLRGDRSIFTRRAARLLSTTEAREVLAHYERDDAFRTHVNRYIADFEAMLRRLIDSRAGQDLSITLLSSDVGKVYVALAQSIERLRN